MNYRIRYRRSPLAREDEAVVEANSPNEALVKFQCTQQHHLCGRDDGKMVTSVCAAEEADALPW